MKKIISEIKVPDLIQMLDSYKTDYPNTTSVCDLSDNAVDAHTDKLYINYDYTNKSLSIKDFGIGMSAKTLCEAMRIGTQKARNISALGKFGIGLKSASMSLGKKVEIYSNEKNSKQVYACLDYDELCNREQISLDDFNVDVYEVSDEIIQESGTTVIISKLHSDVIKEFENDKDLHKLKTYIGRIFKEKIEEGLEIYVNDELIQLVDILNSSNDKIQVIEEEFEYDGCNIKLRIAIPKEGTLASELDDPNFTYNQINQGIYLVRNGREIAGGQTLGIFTKDPHLNAFRLTIGYDSKADHFMEVGVTKSTMKTSADFQAILSEKISKYKNKAINNIRSTKAKEEIKSDNVILGIDKKLQKRRSKLNLPCDINVAENIAQEDPKSDTSITSKITGEYVLYDIVLIDDIDEYSYYYFPDFDPITGKLLLNINTKHIFYEKLHELDVNARNFIMEMLYCKGITEVQSSADNKRLAAQNRSRESIQLSIVMED